MNTGLRIVGLGAGILVLTLLSGCGKPDWEQASVSTSATGEGSSAANFPDGTYSCEVSDTTDDNGPYSLVCDKNGSEVVAHFENGGYITGELDSASKDQMVFLGTDSRDHDWQIIISR